jgi:AGCS family alanine or glycine:cation symporter
MIYKNLKPFAVFCILLCLCLSPLIQTISAQEEAPTENVADAGAPSTEDHVSTLSRVNTFIFKFLFFDISGGAFDRAAVDDQGNAVLDDQGAPAIREVPVPFLIFFLLAGAIFFTCMHRFITFRGFRHSINVIRGKYDSPEDVGEITHFRALTSALSATVGLGNIAGVAVAIQLGGPGAVFWMWVTALFGMASKFNSCTLSQLYRQVNADGSISGGPMYYLDLGLKAKGPGYGVLGKILGVMFAIMVMGGAIGGGNMFQANQTVEAITDTFQLDQNLVLSFPQYEELLAANPEHAEILKLIARTPTGNGEIHLHLNDLGAADQAALGDTFPELKRQASETTRWGIALILAILAGVVILGGIKRIAAATCRIVPIMCGIYVIAALFVILSHFSQIPACFKLIISMAFSGNAVYGGLVGVLVYGITRAAFSNEAGLGSAAIAHAAAKTNEPVREGMVAMIGPVIDTLVVCTMTALVVIITGAWNDPSIPQSAGVSLTTQAFGSVISWFPYVLTACITLFAYSTMISWCYYGERGWIYLLDHVHGLGMKTVCVFRLVFVGAIVVGAVHPLSEVLDFSDAMILSMSLPNILGSVILAPVVWKITSSYLHRLRIGEIHPSAKKTSGKS